MLDIDAFPQQYFETTFTGPRSENEFKNIIRQNDKILLEATDQSTKYITQRNRLGSSFEALFRSVGLAAGVVLGGPVGSVAMATIGGGVGRGFGEYLGNRVYGETIHKLNNIQSEYKYRQLINYYSTNQIRGKKQLIDEFYNQSLQEETQTINELNQQ
ncbi:MAG: hypothetical protein SFT81_05110 [Candidatus Caenarcaniphilales bacterium]|nr:hypothetical protein [Candidatus Caenarcaniphilales bacterium]